jgi:hypothetical protein
MRNHPVFRIFDLEEDSCIIAVHRADERRRQRLRTERTDEERTEPSRYEAADEDLPEIFWAERPRREATKSG